MSHCPTYFLNEAFINHHSLAYRATDEHYLDVSQSSIILEPLIQSSVIKENYLDLFIPRYKREDGVINDLCGFYQWDEEKSDEENRALRDVHRRNCAQKYYKVHIDNRRLEEIPFNFIYEFKKSGKGYQAYIPIDSLARGRHVIRIESAYESSEEDYYRREIPFYKPN